ncbi:hypothetical protein L4C33_15050, partial [Vibrio makurazakiensis]
ALASSKQTMLGDVILETCARPSLTVDKSAQEAAITKLHLNTERPIIGLCPGVQINVYSNSWLSVMLR